MSELASALADSSALEPYHGLDVVKTTISVRNAGDGLSEGMSIDPEYLPLGSTRFVVLECVVDGHTLKRSKDSPNLLILEQVLKAGNAVIVDGESVREMLETQAEKIRAAREAADPQSQIPGTERKGRKAKDTAEIEAPGMWQESPEDAHEAGKHADGLHPDCGECNAELAAQESEAEERRQATILSEQIPRGPLRSVPDPEPTTKKSSAK